MASKYFKLNDKDSTLLCMTVNEDIITNVKMFFGGKWQKASPFYIKLVLLGNNTDRLECFGTYLTKKECLAEVNERFGLDNNNSISK